MNLSGLQTILYGGLIIGILDNLDANIALGLLKGLSPLRILQTIASGLLGPAAYRGGVTTALLGVALHFLIAFTVATVYWFASRRVTGLRSHPIVWGMLYGVGVYLVMNFVVLPLSAMAHGPFSLPIFMNGIIGHAFLVGLPIGWLTSKSEDRPIRSSARKTA